ncbi:MAG: PAS domain-containing protein [SAR324 cluster bacterium]
MFIKDPQSRFVLVNAGFARFYGLTPPQLQGLPSSELPGVPPAEAEAWSEQDRKVVETGQPVLLREVRQSGPQGREVWVDLRKYPWRDDKNRVIGVVGVREDISERRHTEELVRANRRLLRTVFDTIPHLLYVKDVNSRYLMVNQAMADVYGLTPEAMAGTYTLDMPNLSPEQRQELLETDRMVIQSGTPVFQPEVPLSEGARGNRWYAITKLPLRNAEGRIVGLVGMSEDITDRLRAESQHRMDRRLLRAVFDAVPFWLMVRDTRGRATLANRCMARDYGVEPEDFLGKVMEEDAHLKPEEKTALQAVAAQVERTLRPVAIPEIGVTLPGGVVRLMRLVDIPLFDDAGKWEGALILAEDITERKRSEDALLQAQKLESLGVLAGGIAHDFNNLLVAVLGNASLALLKLQEDAPCREELRQIELAGQRAAELCRQMLAYAGQGPLEMQRVDVNLLVQEMAQLLKVSLPKGAAFQFRLEPDLPAVEGDPTQMRQVVMNLVINAGEAIGDKQGVITLTTGTQDCDQAYLSSSQAAPDAQPGRYVFVEVSDTGHGMAPATLSRIFDPFFTTKFTGRGLGLASVIGIIRAHRGALRVYSEPGVGSAFRVLLPMAGTASAGQESVPGPRPWAAGGDVLLVDDEADIRAVAEKMLTYLGFTVVQAADGQEAIRALRARRTPLVAALVDLTMPGMTGEELVRELRRVQDLPVLVMSGYHERDVRNRFIGRQKTGFLQKPFTLSSLHAKMRDLLGDPGDG